jgi:DNA-binding MarR family transcriptional regulator
MTNDTQKMLAALEKQLADLKKSMAAPKRTRNTELEEKVLAALASGPLTMPAIQEKLGITKSSAHTAVDALAIEGKVWIQKWPNPEKPGRFLNRVFLDSQIAT